MLPKHVAFMTRGNVTWAKQNSKTVSEAYRLRLQKILSLVDQQVKHKIPIFTFYLFSSSIQKEAEFFEHYLEELITFFEGLRTNKIIHENRIKISVLGKWYNLPSRLVEPIKLAIEETRDYDGLFLNLCLNYDGQEELVDACRVLALKVRSNKLDPEGITKDEIKENLYSSYFMPPDIIVVNYNVPVLSGFLLWDSVDSYVYMTGKLWPDFTVRDFSDILKRYEKEKPSTN